MHAGDTLYSQPGYREQTNPPIGLEAGQCYEVNTEVPLEPIDNFFGSPVLVRIQASNTRFAVIDTRWDSERIGADYILVQELDDGQIHSQTQGIAFNESTRVGRLNNNSRFQLDNSVSEEHFVISYDDSGLVITDLDITNGTVLEVPYRRGGHLGSVDDAPRGFEGAYYSPRTYLASAKSARLLGSTVREPLGGAWPNFGPLADKFVRVGGAAVSALRARLGEQREKTEVLPVIEAELAEVILEKAEIRASEYKGKDLKTEDLARFGLEPKYAVHLDGVDIYFSDTYQFHENRLAVVGYVVSPDQKVVARTYYLSNSQGLWRYLPSYIDSEVERWLDKGHGQESLNLPIEAQAALGTISAKDSRQIEDPALAFFGTALDLSQSEAKTYYREVEKEPLKLSGGFYTHSRDNGVRAPEAVDFNNEGEAPDFTVLQRSWSQLSPLYGTINMEVYLSKDRRYSYIFGSDPAGRSWTAGIENKSPVMTTGVRARWVSGGSLLMPLCEYIEESGGYGSSEVNGHYTNMWDNYLSRVPVIQRLMASRNQ